LKPARADSSGDPLLKKAHHKKGLAKKHMKKGSPIPDHKGKASQNHTKIPPHSC
jgi:hypothetical protein